jgi:hypothetical protein
VKTLTDAERAQRTREGFILAHEKGGHEKYGNAIKGCPLCSTPAKAAPGA